MRISDWSSDVCSSDLPELGPKGAYGIPLIGQRAVAVDTKFVPLGAPLYLSTQLPASSTPLRRLVFAQDTGAAIKGAARIDYYWGFGDERSEEHTSELQSLMRISYAVFCLKKKKTAHSLRKYTRRYSQHHTKLQSKMINTYEYIQRN